jgi:Helix-turn-helix domain
MSAKIMGQVWDLEITASQQSVLLAMADHADHEGRNVRPSVRLIAYKSRLSERQVQRIIDSLIECQLLEVVGSEAGGRGKTTEYCIHIEKGDKRTPFSHSSSFNSRPFKDDTMSPISKIKDDTMSPISKIKGDTMSPIPALKGDICETERVTFEMQKGDIPRARAEVFPDEPSEEPKDKRKEKISYISEDILLLNLEIERTDVEDNANLLFDVFWKVYPRKVGKKKALEAWRKIKPSVSQVLLDQMLSTLSWQSLTDQWQKGVIPHPTTWLHDERWNDEPDKTPPSPPSLAPGESAIMRTAMARAERLAALTGTDVYGNPLPPALPENDMSRENARGAPRSIRLEK